MNLIDAQTPEAPQPPQTPRWVLWLVLIGVAGLLMLLSAELLVRIVPGKWSSAFFFRYDPEVGTWHLENSEGDYIQQDYAVRGISFNSFGMRDTERTLEKKPGVVRIAVLGDSFIEGIQVGNEEVLTRRLEELLGSNVEVLNFGVSGFGTAQEYVTYITRVRQFKPDIVLLGFLSSNDMRNNSRELEGLYNGSSREMPFLEKKEDGTWALTPVPPKSGAQNPLVLFVKEHIVLYRFFWFQKQYFAGFFRAPAPEGTAEPEESENSNVYLARLFAPPQHEGPVFQNAWEATDELLRMLQDEVERDGARLVVVSLPDGTLVEKDIRGALEKAYGGALPESYDADYPGTRLAKLASREGFGFLDLVPVFREYRDEHDLEPPYFSYEHDGHWAPLGHEVAARAIAEYLRTNHLTPL